MIGCVLLALAAAARPQQGVPLPERLRGARDASADGLAFVELEAPPPEPFVHARVRIVVRFGLEERFLAERAVQPYRQRLDVPARLVLPWVEGLSGARPSPASTEPAAGATVAVNDAVHRAHRVADRVEGGRTYRVYELELALVPDRPGLLALPAPVLGLAYATRFTETLLDPRVPVDRTDVMVVGEPLQLTVHALPEQGRPAGFTGAVGPVRVRASAPVPEVRLGQSLKLELVVEGAGDPAAFGVPAWDELGAFRVLGVLDDVRGAARVLLLDLAPTNERAWQVPPVPFAYFDPGPPPGYHTARSEPVEVTVLPAPAGPTPAPPAPAPHVPATEPPRDGTAGRTVLLTGLCLAAALGLGVWLGRRSGRRAG